MRRTPILLAAAAALALGLTQTPAAAGPAETGLRPAGLRPAVATLPSGECSSCEECFGENYFKGTGTPCTLCHSFEDTDGWCVYGWCAECTPDEEEDLEDVKELAEGLSSPDGDLRQRTLAEHSDRLVLNAEQGTVLVLGGCSGTAVIAEVPLGGADGLAGTLVATGTELRRFEDLIPATFDGTPGYVFGTIETTIDRWADLD